MTDRAQNFDERPRRHHGGLRTMPGKIFVNYRRDDAAADSRGVRDGLAAKFGEQNVFIDVDDLKPGQRFDVELAKALDACDVFVAIIGPRWMDLLRQRHVEREYDYVRAEIAAALQRGINTIPVLVGREGNMPRLPRPEELPEDLRVLAFHHKHDVTHERFRRDMADLIRAVEALRSRRIPGHGRTGRTWGPATPAECVMALLQSSASPMSSWTLTT